MIEISEIHRTIEHRVIIYFLTQKIFLIIIFTQNFFLIYFFKPKFFFLFIFLT
jgi:hypothetical protein